MSPALSAIQIKTLNMVKERIPEGSNGRIQPDVLLDFFQLLSEHRQTIRDCQGKGKVFSAFEKKLARFLATLLPALESGALDLSTLDLEQRTQIGHGLGALIGRHQGLLFSRELIDQHNLRGCIASLTDALLTRLNSGKVFPHAQHNGLVLNLLTWLGRGLKAGVLSPSNALIRDAFAATLPLMQDWSRSTLTLPQLVKCFVQLNTMRKLGLVDMSASRKGQTNWQTLGDTVRYLCRPAMLPDVCAMLDAVKLSNVANTLKDFIDENLIRANDPALQPALMALLAAVNHLDLAKASKNDLQSIGNIGNFLRTFFEHAMTEGERELMPVYDACNVASCRIVDFLAGMDAARHGQAINLQALCNLASLVKAQDRYSEWRRAAARDDRRAQCRSAITRIVATLARFRDLNGLAVEGIAGLFAAMTYFQQKHANLPESQDVIVHLCQAMLDRRQSGWQGDSIALMLRNLVAALSRPGSWRIDQHATAHAALKNLLEKILPDQSLTLTGEHLLAGLQAIQYAVTQGVVDIDACQSTLTRLLGAGRYTLEDLARAIGERIHGLVNSPATTPVLPVAIEEADTVVAKAAAPVEKKPTYWGPVAEIPVRTTSPSLASPRQRPDIGNVRITVADEAASRPGISVVKGMKIELESLAPVEAVKSALPQPPRNRAPQIKALVAKKKAEPVSARQPDRAAARTPHGGKVSFTQQKQAWFAALKKPSSGTLKELKAIVERLDPSKRAEWMADRDAQGRSALFYALGQGLTGVVDWLLQHPGVLKKSNLSLREILLTIHEQDEQQVCKALSIVLTKMKKDPETWEQARVELQESTGFDHLLDIKALLVARGIVAAPKAVLGDRHETAIGNRRAGGGKSGRQAIVPANVSEIADVSRGNTPLTVLDLGKLKIGPSGAKAIAETLQGNTVLTSLYLTRNEIGTEGAIAIAAALPRNTRLSILDLASNKIGPAGAKAIAEALRDNTTLTSLNLDKNEIGSEGAIASAAALQRNTTLISLYLSDNEIGPAGAEAIVRAVRDNPMLCSLTLADNKIGSEGAKAIAGALQGNTTLRNLWIVNNEIGTEGAEAIAHAVRGNAKLTVLTDTYRGPGAEHKRTLAEIEARLMLNRELSQPLS